NFKEFQYSTREKTYIEKLFGATPDTFQGSVFLHDPLSYTRVLLRGMEPSILIGYALIFVCIDVGLNSVPAAALGIYLIDCMVVFTRSHFGEQNLSAKTLLDWKFLV
ncbi:UNVERIFIED_CONTAM: Meckelin, partial [Siphonaria sp. JEL0065]